MSSCKEWICTNKGGWRRGRPLVSVSVIMNHPTICHRYPLHLVPGWRKVCIASFFSCFYENRPTNYKYKTKQYSSPLLWNDQRSTSTRTNTLKHTLTSLSMLVEKKENQPNKQNKLHVFIYIYIFIKSLLSVHGSQWPALRIVSVVGFSLSVASVLMKQRSSWSKVRRRARRRAAAGPSFRCSSEHLAPSQQGHLRGDGQERSQGWISSPWLCGKHAQLNGSLAAAIKRGGNKVVTCWEPVGGVVNPTGAWRHGLPSVYAPAAVFLFGFLVVVLWRGLAARHVNLEAKAVLAVVVDWLCCCGQHKKFARKL